MFDQPLREQHLTLPPNPADPNPSAHPKVSCYYYPDLMVKEVDLEGLKGAGQLSMVTLRKGQAEPACRRENIDGETVIRDWSGYFRGVRQGYVFFDGSDGANGGRPFAVYDSAGDGKIFSDVAAPLLSVKPLLPPRDPELRPWYYHPLTLTYRKFYVAPCSMRSDATHCWAMIKQATGLTKATMPDCDAAYGVEEKGLSAEQREDLRSDPSVITYVVEAVIDGQGVAHITPQSSALKCFPADTPASRFGYAAHKGRIAPGHGR
ncbi:hypothetical protein [Dyella koreensis]|uniref:Uncharacterized protein n=1 Tax=Dyella koreensis TaxID=311235 RepID=A0ABW8KAP4_9GAMM